MNPSDFGRPQSDETDRLAPEPTEPPRSAGVECDVKDPRDRSRFTSIVPEHSVSPPSGGPARSAPVLSAG